MNSASPLRRHDDILSTIGNTPVVRINRLAPEGVRMFVKMESFNPMGSVKDRMARNVINVAEREGHLQPGQTVIEATSGNTGIGLAMVCAAKGYPLVLCMAENFSVERRKILRFLGARVVLTPAALKGSGMLAKAEELAEAHGWFLCRQFENEANADAHTETTAVEILEQFADIGLDYWVTGYGTGGTLKGTSRVLREKSPQTRIVVCEPDNSPLLGSGIKQQRNTDGQASDSHPLFRPHLMQGWTPDFIPRLTEDAVADGMIDELMPVAGSDALEYATELARQEGLFVGITGGATFAGAVSVARKAAPGESILCMLPDTGERYLSTPMFEGVSTEMTEEELAISRSTPNYRFDSQPATTPDEPAEEIPETTKKARDFVAEVIGDARQPVVLFALEWCEFCWSARKLFGAFDIPFRSVDLDSVDYQKDNWGGEIRAVLHARTGSRTIPQIFVSGKHLGGCTEMFDAFSSGHLGRLLRKAGIEMKAADGKDPYEFLPKWLHTR